jgi:hypothetical protein
MISEEDSPKTAEQEARDILERIGVSGAQDFRASDLVELANLIVEVRRLRTLLGHQEESAFLHGFSIFPREPPPRR